MFEINIDSSQLDNFILAMEKFPEKIEATMSEAMTIAEQTVHEEMIVHPDPIPYPPSNVKWDSRKQQIAFHLTDGFGGGDPYMRQGNLDSALQNTPVQVTPGLVHGSVMSIEEWTRFLLGGVGTQSNIHQGRWRNIEKIRDDVKDRVVDTFQSAVNKLVGEFKVG